MSDSSYSSAPDKNNPNPIDLSRVFGGGASTPPPAQKKPEGEVKAKGISVPTLLICLALCMATILVSVLVSAGTYVWIRTKGVTSVNQKTIIYQNVTQSVGDASGLPVQAQVQTVQNTMQSVVEILAAETEQAYKDGSYGYGSGVIWGSGEDELNAFTYIVTNEHVVANRDGAAKPYADYIWVKVHGDETYRYPARLVAADAENDLALLEIDAFGLRPVTPAPSSSMQVGMSVFAIGNPLGILGTSVTYGGISAVDRQVPISDSAVEGGYRYMYLIQHDASVNSGNSGGGLFDYYGNLLGIVNAKIAATGVEGLGYAIPIDRVQSVISAMVATDTAAAKALIGIGVINFDGLSDTKAAFAEQADYAAVLDHLIPGEAGVYVYVKNKSDSPLTVGDRILYLSDYNLNPNNPLESLFVPKTKVTSLESLRIFLADHVAGQTVYLVIERAGQNITVPVTLYSAS